MILLGVLAILLILAFFIFVFVILFGAPYVPTLKNQRQNALKLLDLKPGQKFYELGSGDGTMLIEAAQRGWAAVGYELNPILVIISRVRARRYKGRVRVVWGNFWKADISDADGIFVFQLDRLMERLDSKIKRETAGRKLKLASNAFRVPGKKPTGKSGSVFLYRYP